MPLLTTGVGKYGAAAAPAGYQGAGDIVSGAECWFGLRAYNAAYAAATGPIMEIVNSSGNGATVINSLTDGSLDVATIATWEGTYGVNARVKTLYDQSGHGLHVSMSDVNFRPLVILSALGSLPGMRFDNTLTKYLNRPASHPAMSQPFTMSTAAKPSGDGGTVGILFGGGGVAVIGLGNNLCQIYSGTGASATATGNVFHAAQAMFKGATSKIYVDGVLTGVSDTNAPAGGDIQIGSNGFGDYYDGDIFEFGVWDLEFSDAQLAQMSVNQTDYWT